MKKGIGSILAFIGIVLILNSFSGITGFVIIENINKNVSGIFGFAFFVAGVLLFLQQQTRGLEVFISNEAIKRSGKDRFIRNNLGAYRREIAMIIANPVARPQEIMGKFRVSPRGESLKGLRVAWHFDSQSGRLYIDDLLYHEKEGKYVGRWNRRVRNGEITPETYVSSGLVGYSEAALS